MKQGTYWESRNIRCHHTKCSHLGDLPPGIFAPDL